MALDDAKVEDRRQKVLSILNNVRNYYDCKGIFSSSYFFSGSSCCNYQKGKKKEKNGALLERNVHAICHSSTMCIVQLNV